VLKITAYQMDAFKKAQFQDFSKRVLIHLEKEGLADSLPDNKLNFVNEQLFLLREKTGLDSEQHLVDMLNILLLQGVSFFNRIEAKMIIDNPILSNQKKCQQLKGLVNE